MSLSKKNFCTRKKCTVFLISRSESHYWGLFLISCACLYITTKRLVGLLKVSWQSSYLLQQAIARASTLEEVERLKQLLLSGQIPSNKPASNPQATGEKKRLFMIKG